MVLWCLRVFSLADQISPNENNYSPNYNIQEFKGALENISNKIFILGENLILDEIIIRDFGHIKFKVIIVTKHLVRDQYICFYR